MWIPSLMRDLELKAFPRKSFTADVFLCQSARWTDRPTKPVCWNCHLPSVTIGKVASRIVQNNLRTHGTNTALKPHST
jgi:hypothetical protein